MSMTWETSGRTAGQRRVVAPPHNPGPWIALICVAVIGVAAGTILGVTMSRDRSQTLQGAPQSTPQVATETQIAAEAQVAAEAQAAIDLQAAAPADTVSEPETAPSAVNEAPAPAGVVAEGVSVSVAAPVETAAASAAAQQGFSVLEPLAAPAVSEAIALIKPPAYDPGRIESANSEASVVEVAETEAQAAAIERRMADEGLSYFALPEKPAGPFDELRASGGLVTRRIAEYVNLHTGPGNDDPVIAIIPAGTDVLAEENCPSWCATVYDGRKGYVFTSFFAGQAGKAAAAPSSGAMTKSLTTKWVNLRATPDSGSEVIAVIPASAEVMTKDGCRGWCATVYNGKKGYVSWELLKRP